MNEDLLKKIRDKIRQQQDSKGDPAQYRVPNVKPGATLKTKFVVLPGVVKGDKCTNGLATATMDEMVFADGTKEASFCVKGGQHWINRRPYGCPRLFDNEDCPICSLGFDLLNECDVPEERSSIIKLYMPQSVFAVNIYFPEFASNPEELRGKVLWYTLPKGVYNKMEETLLREDDGGDPDDPKPFGMFYDPSNCLVFQLDVCHKSGYNNYDASKFLNKRGALADSEEKIVEILSKRHDVMAKFPKRNPKELGELIAKIHKGDDSQPDKQPEDKKVEKTPEPDEELPKAKTKKAEPKPEVKAEDKKSKAEPKVDKPKTEEKPRPAAVIDDIDDPELRDLINQAKDHD